MPGHETIVDDAELAIIEADEAARIAALEQDDPSFAMVRTSLTSTRPIDCARCYGCGLLEASATICPRCRGAGRHAPRRTNDRPMRSSWGTR